MYPVASANAAFAILSANIGLGLVYVLGLLLAGLGGLLVLGFAIRHVKKWITGRKA